MRYTAPVSLRNWWGWLLSAFLGTIIFMLASYIAICWLLLTASGIKVDLNFPTLSEQIQWERSSRGKILGKYSFPVLGNHSYADTWGAPRSFGGDRQHEGTDIFALFGTPLVAVTDGWLEKVGWNTYGGWRIGLRGEDGLYYYYAHLSAYAAGIYQGKWVNQGEVLGYVGDSGYGPPGTTGRFAPHLHFGIYLGDKATNPYPYLKMWEGAR